MVTGVPFVSLLMAAETIVVLFGVFGLFEALF